MARSKNRSKTANKKLGCSDKELFSLFPTKMVNRQMPGSALKNERIKQIVLEREMLILELLEVAIMVVGTQLQIYGTGLNQKSKNYVVS